MQFEGFSKSTLEFFMAIAFNNDAGFFDQNRSWYQRDVLEPLKVLCTELAPTVLKIDPQVDTRFTRDKSPYRDHMWISFRHAGQAISQSRSFYFALEPDSASWGMGFYRATPAQMKRVREHILAQSGQFMRIISRLDESRWALVGEDYKRLPEGTQDAPEKLLPWVRKKSFSITREVPITPMIFSRQLLDEVRADFMALAPLYQFVHRALGEGEAQQ